MLFLVSRPKMYTMTSRYHSYKVEIKNLKFTSDRGVLYPKTAIITFFNAQKEPVGVELMGFMETSELYRMIRDGEELILDQCYVCNFSLSVFRKESAMDKKELVPIKGLSAKDAFFESQFGTDFSYADFIDGNVDFSGSHFLKGQTSFANCRMGKGIFRFSGVYMRNGNIDFSNSSFGQGDFLCKNTVFGSGIRDFQDVAFGEGEVNFANTEFGVGETLFINSQFGCGSVSFKVARFFDGRIDFHYATFGSGDISFERTEFGNSKVDFRTVDFGEGRVNFNRSVFGDGDVTFEGTELSKGRFFFKRVSMGNGSRSFELMNCPSSEVNFEKTDFGNGPISFHNSKYRQLILKSCHIDHYLDLRVAEAWKLDLSDTIARDIIDMEPYDFDVNIQVLDMSGMRLLGRIYIDWRLNRCHQMIQEQMETTSLRQKAEQYRILKENFNATGKYEDEDKAYIEFKRHEARADLQDRSRNKPWSKLYLLPGHWFKHLIFDLVGQYATNPIRVLFSMLVAYVFFSLVYFFDMVFTNADIVASVDDHLSTVAKAFYHSAITFLTIGYGDHYPYLSIRWISGIEGFAGLFLMSYFTVAFVRKILR